MSRFFKGDSAPSPSSTSLYDLQLLIYVLFTFTCNVLLLNLLIALMGSVFQRVADEAAAQYRLDKTYLMISLEELFLRSKRHALCNPWVIVMAPEECDLWSETAKDYAMVAMETRINDKIDEASRRTEAKIEELRALITSIRADGR